MLSKASWDITRCNQCGQIVDSEVGQCPDCGNLLPVPPLFRHPLTWFGISLCGLSVYSALGYAIMRLLRF